MKNRAAHLIPALAIALLLCLAVIFHLLGGFGRLSAWLERQRQAAEDKHLQYAEAVIFVDGLSRDYRFLFLSDTHVVTEGDTDSSDVCAYAASRLPLFANAQGMSSARQFSGWIRLANSLNADALLLGGDIIDCPSDSNLAFLSEQLSALRIPYLYTPGNHDWTYPWAYLNDHAEAAYRPLLAPFMDGNPSFHTLELDGLILAAVDDSSDQVRPDVLEPLAETLASGKPVILLTHVPLAAPELAAEAAEVWGSPIVLGEGGIAPDETSAAFLEMISAGDSPVAAVLSGHVHFPSAQILPCGIPQYVADGAYRGNGLLITVTGSPQQS